MARASRRITSGLLFAGSLMLGAGTGSAATERSPLRYGGASIAVGMDGARIWNPQAFRPLHVAVRARVRPSQRATHKAFVRYQLGARSCGPSYARGRGRPYGPFGAFTADRQGYFGGRTGSTVTIRHVGNVRFCVWVAPSPRTVVRATIQDVPFHDVLFGATITAHGSYWPPPAWTTWYAVGTQPFAETRSGTSCNGSAEPTTTTTRELDSRSSLATAGSAGGPAGTDNCNETRTVAFRLLAGFAGQLDQGSLSFTAAERRSVPSPIKHLGNACVFDPALFRGVAEAKAYIVAVGCRPGRVLKDPATRDLGMVKGFQVRGARAMIASPGTTIDLVVASAT